MSNLYYEPDDFGMQIVGEAEFSSRCYEFDTTVVWQDNGTGKCYFADDSGCSCPVPFDGIKVPDLTEIDRLQTLIDHLEQRKEDTYRYDAEYSPDAVREIDGECGDLILKVKQAMA